MDDLSLMNWLFNKDNPPDNKDNQFNVMMSSIYSDPKTGSFVSTLATDQPTFHSTTTCTKKDDITIKIAMSWALTDWGFDNYNPPNNTTVFSLQYDKKGKLVRTPLSSSLSFIHSSTTHTNVNNTKN